MFLLSLSRHYSILISSSADKWWTRLQNLSQAKALKKSKAIATAAIAICIKSKELLLILCMSFLCNHFAFLLTLLLVLSCCCLFHHFSAVDNTSNVLKHLVKIFAHVLALCLNIDILGLIFFIRTLNQNVVVVHIYPFILLLPDSVRR